jgi:pimeloyl-ACP methyl ester carboxylesterase
MTRLAQLSERFSMKSTPTRQKGAQGRHQFGPFVLDPAERLLTQSGRNVVLRAKAFDTLCVLVERAGRLVSKEELMDRVWPGDVVEENNLSQSVSLIRRALGGGSLDYIETVPGQGYRFTAAVSRVQNGGAKPPASAKSPAVGGQSPPRAPETRYANSGDLKIAYQIVGSGPVDIVFVMGWVSHLEYFWRHPLFARFLSRLASFSRLILFDKRGTGLSDRVPLTGLPTLEQRMEDVHAVMDAAGSTRATLIGVSEGGPMCSLFAATYPERTNALVMIGTYAKRVWDKEYPWAPRPDERERFFDTIRRDWGGPVGIEARAPSLALDPEFREWWATYLRMGASPGAALALTQMNSEIDIRRVLPSVRVPTLVLHRSGDMCLKVEEGRFVASLIPGARFVELPGRDHLPFVGAQEEILDEIERFVGSPGVRVDQDSLLTTILATDVPTFGPGASRAVSEFVAQARGDIASFRGRSINPEARNLSAMFDGPVRAIRCASAVQDRAALAGVRARIGLHTGECELRGERLNGMAVEIAERLAREAPLGGVLVSRTVTDLVAGSGIRFYDHGSLPLRRDHGELRLFRVA